MTPLRVGLAYNLKSEYVFQPGDPEDANAEFDHPDTIRVISEALEHGGHRVIRLGNAQQILERADELAVDIVFNITEGYRGRNRESQVPIILEMMGIPFVGSDGLTLGLTLDKVLTKKILISEGIPTPRFVEVKDPDVAMEGGLKFPLIVKPKWEGSSKGLCEHSLVRNRAQLKEQAARIIESYHQPALVEEFVTGTEFTIAVIGNDPPEPFPPVQIAIDGVLKLGELFYTNERIKSPALTYICPAKVSARLQRRLMQAALRTYQAVECRDFGRVDIRMTAAGEPYVLEINPLPSLSTEDVFPLIAKVRGLTYAQVINRILQEALQRHGMAPRKRSRRLFRRQAVRALMPVVS